MANKFSHKKYKAKYTNSGEIKRAALYQNSKCDETSRIPPNYKWFQSTRTLNTKTIENYREEAKDVELTPYDVLMNKSQIPYSLFIDQNDGPKKMKPEYRMIKKGKPNIKFTDFKEYKEQIKNIKIEEKKEIDIKKRIKGQSNRIWSELYKVIDSSQVLIYIVDVRDPMGTISEHLINTIKEKNKPLFLILNKTDLVPTSVTKDWMNLLLTKFNIPILSFSALSVERNFGKEALLNLMRQYTKLFRKPSNYKKNENKNQNQSLECVAFGLLGMPNAGKSSIINVLKRNDACSVAPIAGETKVWQYVAVSKFMYVIDSPGVVPIKDPRKAILRGAIRIEKLSDSELETAIEDILEKHGEAVKKTYSINFDSKADFIEKFGRKYGKITKGNSVDTFTVCQIVLKDFLRGKIPFYISAEK